jgi:hypothetical protein
LKRELGPGTGNGPTGDAAEATGELVQAADFLPDAAHTSPESLKNWASLLTTEAFSMVLCEPKVTQTAALRCWSDKLQFVVE